MSMKVKVSSKNQITLPAKVRRELDIEPGDHLFIVVLDGRIHAMREPDDVLELLRELGRGVRQDVDVEEYINQERDAWESSPNAHVRKTRDC